MAANWWSQTVYPPRYFCGFVQTAGRRPEQIDMIDAPILPLNRHAAAILAGTRGGCYYSAAWIRRPVRLRAIQYAISTLDPRRRRLRVEKFNHTFDGPTMLGNLDGLTCLYTEDGAPLYATYPLGQVLDNLPGVRRPVLQFIA